MTGPEGNFVHPQFRETHTYIQSFIHQHLRSVLSLCTLMLCHLDLINNDFGSTGVRRLVGVLVLCQTLSHLNTTGDDGAGRFAGVLAQCPVLSTLNLNRNQFILN